MNSHEALRRAVENVGAKKVAHDLKVSTSLVYKWCEEDTSGARNPLDRTQGIVESTGSRIPIEWLCRQSGGFFMKDPAVELAGFDAEYITHTQTMLSNFSELLREISSSMSNDGQVDRREAARIREQWERLKGYGETFVAACEAGMFAPREEDAEEA